MNVWTLVIALALITIIVYAWILFSKAIVKLFGVEDYVGEEDKNE